MDSETSVRGDEELILHNMIDLLQSSFNSPVNVQDFSTQN